jgi:hypothetical protein
MRLGFRNARGRWQPSTFFWAPLLVTVPTTDHDRSRCPFCSHHDDSFISAPSRSRLSTHNKPSKVTARKVYQVSSVFIGLVGSFIGLVGYFVGLVGYFVGLADVVGFGARLGGLVGY